MASISIIIPVYNAAPFLPQCLKSVCGQTLRDLEIICINDCSSDDSLSILQAYASKDARITVIDLKENRGAAVARNIGINHASGHYLGFVDGDDFIDSHFYETLYEKALSTNAEVVKGNLKLYCPKTNIAKKEGWIDINEAVKKHKAHFYFSFTSAIYQTSFIKANQIAFLEGLIHFEDPYFTIKAALFYEKLEVVDDVFYYYVNNPQSASRQKVGMQHVVSLIAGAEKVLDMLDSHCLDKTHYMIIFNFLIEQLLCWCNRMDVKDDVTQKAVSGLFLLYRRCQHQEDCAAYYFLNKKKNHTIDMIKQLRLNVKNNIHNA